MKPLPLQLETEKHADLCERIDILLEEWLYEVRHYGREGELVASVREVMKVYSTELREDARKTREFHEMTVQAKAGTVE